MANFLQWQCKLQQSAAFFSVLRAHRTAVRLHDGHADGQADTHIAPLIRDFLVIAGEIAFKQMRQQFLLNAAAVVRNGEDDAAVLFGKLHFYRSALGIELDRIIQQICPYVEHKAFIAGA